jgi:DNA-binding NtrC family response regulator
MSGNFPFKIFLVDEDLFSLAMYEQHFRNMDCRDVQLFDSIACCVHKFDEKPQVIFLDYRLNPEKGLKILATIKKLIPEAYIVFISGPSGIIELLFSLREGAFEYILKDSNYPVYIEATLKKIVQIETMLYNKPL